MIYVEKKFKLKNNNYIEFKNESELFELFYQNNFDKEEYIRNNKVESNTFIKMKEFENKFYLAEEEINFIEEKTKYLGVISKHDFFKDFVENYDNLDKLENKKEEILYLKINENNVQEDIVLEPAQKKFYYTDIESTVFKDIEEDIKKSDFIKTFDSFAFGISEEGETFIVLKKEGNNILLDKEFIEDMIEKYRENEIQFIPPTADSGVGELADDYKEYIRQESYELEF